MIQPLVLQIACSVRHGRQANLPGLPTISDTCALPQISAGYKRWSESGPGTARNADSARDTFLPSEQPAASRFPRYVPGWGDARQPVVQGRSLAGVTDCPDVLDLGSRCRL